MVVVLDRERHEEMITRIRAAGARIRLISDGDVSGALLAVMPDTGVDLLWGIGGTPEGVLSACRHHAASAARCSAVCGRATRPRRSSPARRATTPRVLATEDLVASEDCFFAATGVTDGDLVRGVRFDATGATTQSLVMRGRSGTIRKVDAHHHRAKLRALMGDRYG